MDHAQLQAIGDRLRTRHEKNRVLREKHERKDGLRLLVLGLLGGAVVVGVLMFSFVA